jgi:hypothetical protein
MDKKSVMKSPYDSIKDVNDFKDVWIFDVRVVDIWSCTCKKHNKGY